jgi:glycerol-3-phosphate dehydrogenase
MQSVAPFSIVNRSDAYYVVTTGDGEAYAERLMSACSELGIQFRHIARETVLESEPNLTNDVLFALAVPDWVMDPMLLLAGYLESLTSEGVPVLSEARLLDVSHHRGRWCVELSSDRAARTVVECEVVVVAAGAWNAEVLRSFGIELSLHYVNGAMFVTEAPLVSRVVTLCSDPSSGDSIIPCYGTTLLGSTWSAQATPTPTAATPEDTRQVIMNLARILPGLRFESVTRSYSGVRCFVPSVPGPSGPPSRRAPREFNFLEQRPGGGGAVVSVFGGKLSLHMMMAGEALERTCRQLRVSPQDGILSVPLSPPKSRPAFHLGGDWRDGSLG